MKRNRKHRMIFVLMISILLIFSLSTTAFAITESEVQAQVDASGREAVSGNVFIWFLCAIAFLKISQKIDSFMSGLGINVGHTGGSMMAEAIIAAKGISEAKGVFSNGFAGFGKRGSRGSAGSSGVDGASGGFNSGGLAGVVSRQINRNAAKNATGQGSGGIGGKVFQSSLEKGGDFANNIIGDIAKGSVSSNGTITGEQAAKGLASYLGYNVQTSHHSVSELSSSSSPGVSSAPSSDISSAPSSPDISSAASSPGISPGSSDMSLEVPAFSDIEIGGGRIMGTETTPENPNGIQFGMYHTDQYMAPEGEHSIVKTVDGTQWYKQYAKDTVEKTPYMAPDGSIAYNEKMVKRLPKMPQRKDRV